jgi:hypothetical protein
VFNGDYLPCIDLSLSLIPLTLPELTGIITTIDTESGTPSPAPEAFPLPRVLRRGAAPSILSSPLESGVGEVRLPTCQPETSLGRAVSISSAQALLSLTIGTDLAPVADPCEITIETGHCTPTQCCTAYMMQHGCTLRQETNFEGCCPWESDYAATCGQGLVCCCSQIGLRCWRARRRMRRKTTWPRS